MSKQVMSILSAKDKKIKTLYPDKVAARKAAAEAEKTELGQALIKGLEEVVEAEEKAAPLKLNRRTRRHLQRMSRKMRKDEVRAKAEFPRYTNDKFKFVGLKKAKGVSDAAFLD